MEITLTLSANAGIALDIGGRRLWVDALHEGKQPGFSTLSPQLQQNMLACEAFFRPEFICYTPCHPDHYSARLTELARKLWPQAELLLPEERTVEKDGLSVRFLKLPHEGEQYADVVHCGIIISCGGINILLSGDCAVAAPELAAALADIPIHVAILDFPWITLKKGRKFLAEHLSGAQIILCHLPFAEDDINGYRLSAKNAALQLQNCKLLWDPLQSIQI